jgi:hypothetical protein
MYCSFTDIGPDMKSAVHTHFSTDYACFASNVKTTLTEIYWHNKMNNTDITNPSLGLVIRRDALSDKHSLIIYTKTKQKQQQTKARTCKQVSTGKRTRTPSIKANRATSSAHLATRCAVAESWTRPQKLAHKHVLYVLLRQYKSVAFVRKEGVRLLLINKIHAYDADTLTLNCTHITTTAHNTSCKQNWRHVKVCCYKLLSTCLLRKLKMLLTCRHHFGDKLKQIIP